MKEPFLLQVYLLAVCSLVPYRMLSGLLGLIYVCFGLFLVAQLAKILMVLKSSVPANYLLRWFWGQNSLLKKVLTSLCRVKSEKPSTRRMTLNNRGPKRGS